MPRKGVVNNPNGRKRIWASPEALMKDFRLYEREQEPHIIKVLDRVAHVKPGHELNDPPCDDDYYWTIEEVPSISKQGVLSIKHFAAWKGVHSTTITTGYSEGEFNEVYGIILTVCEAYAERLLYDAKRNPKAIIFVLKHCYGWSDNPKPDRSYDVDVPLTPEAQAILDKALAR
ncbi:MAG: hypothetical protein ACREHG_06760 [Candidatus Saccharimonadales bacterium]